jgi:hypothetical protein
MALLGRWPAARASWGPAAALAQAATAVRAMSTGSVVDQMIAYAVRGCKVWPDAIRSHARNCLLPPASHHPPPTPPTHHPPTQPPTLGSRRQGNPDQATDVLRSGLTVAGDAGPDAVRCELRGTATQAGDECACACVHWHTAHMSMPPTRTPQASAHDGGAGVGAQQPGGPSQAQEAGRVVAAPAVPLRACHIGGGDCRLLEGGTANGMRRPVLHAGRCGEPVRPGGGCRVQGTRRVGGRRGGAAHVGPSAGSALAAGGRRTGRGGDRGGAGGRGRGELQRPGPVRMARQPRLG